MGKSPLSRPSKVAALGWGVGGTAPGGAARVPGGGSTPPPITGPVEGAVVVAVIPVPETSN